MTDTRYVAASTSFILLIGLVAALGGPVVEGADNIQVVPDGGFLQFVSVDLVIFSFDIPNPLPIFTFVSNVVGLYATILAEGDPILKGLFIIAAIFIVEPIIRIGIDLVEAVRG